LSLAHLLQRCQLVLDVSQAVAANRSIYQLLLVGIQVVDQNSNKVSGATVTASRYLSNGNYVTVSQISTGDDGGVTFWLNPDYSHRFTFVKTGYDNYTTTIK
jgi:hypothetical protein